MEKKWSELTADEKQKIRFERWLSPDEVDFVNPEAEARYKERVQRFIDVITLKEPDRVPVITPAGYIPAHYCGYTIREAMYEPDKVATAWGKYTRDFDHDVIPNARFLRCGRSLDILGAKGLKWAGNGLPDDCDFQIVELESFKADDYDRYLNDRSDYQIRYTLPRAYRAAEPLGKLPPLRTIQGANPVFADPDVLTAFKALGEAGKADQEWRKMISEINQRAMALGVPGFSQAFGGGSPFDRIGAMRGTIGTATDMFKQPDKLIAFMEDAVSAMRSQIARTADMSGPPIAFIALHRGADGWMSEKQFLTFYWPYLRQVVMAYVEEGIVPQLFAEGGYNSRLEIVKELPPGKVIWHFDKTDMVRAKEVLGDRACIMGNVPSSLLVSETPELVKAHCRKLIETVGKDGGYILSYGATPNQSKIENINAMRDSAKEYGVYRK